MNEYVSTWGNDIFKDGSFKAFSVLKEQRRFTIHMSDTVTLDVRS